MTDQNQPTCALCGQEISEEERDFCLATARFNGQLFCAEHQKRFSACPAFVGNRAGVVRAVNSGLKFIVIKEIL